MIDTFLDIEKESFLDLASHDFDDWVLVPYISLEKGITNIVLSSFCIFVLQLWLQMLAKDHQMIKRSMPCTMVLIIIIVPSFVQVST